MKNGHHQFDYKVDASFFEHFGQSVSEEIEMEVELQISMDKSDHMLRFDFHFAGNYASACSRCLVPLETDISGSFYLVVNLGDSYREEDDHLVMIPRTSHEIDLSQYVYDLLMLEMPGQLSCEDPELEENPCDRQMLSELEKYLQTAQEESPVDPRWAALEKFKNK